MFDSLKNLSQIGPMMAKARELQGKMAEVQQRLPAIKAQAESGGGLVTATVNGVMEIVGLDYAPNAPFGDKELLSDLTRAACNQALKNVQEMVRREMQNAAGGLDLGQFQNMLGGGQ